MTDLAFVTGIGLSMAAAVAIMYLAVILWLTISEFRERLKDKATPRDALRAFPKFLRWRWDWPMVAMWSPAIIGGGFAAGVLLAIFGVGLLEVLA